MCIDCRRKKQAEGKAVLVNRVFVIPTIGGRYLLDSVLSVLEGIEKEDRVLIYLNSVDRLEIPRVFDINDQRLRVIAHDGLRLDISDSIHQALLHSYILFDANLYYLLGDDDRFICIGSEPLGNADLYVAEAIYFGKLKHSPPLVRHETEIINSGAFMKVLFSNTNGLDVGRFGMNRAYLELFLDQNHLADGTFHETYAALALSGVELMKKATLIVAPLKNTLVQIGTSEKKSWSKNHSKALFGEAENLYRLPLDCQPEAEMLADRRVHFLSSWIRLFHMRLVQESPIRLPETVANRHPGLQVKVKVVNFLIRLSKLR